MQNAHRRISLLLPIVAILISGPETASAQVFPACVTGPTEPLVWQVPRVERHQVTGEFFGNNYCETTIVVSNLSQKVALVQANFQGAPTGDSCIQSDIAPGYSVAFGTAPMTPIQAVIFAWASGTPGSIIGRASIYSDIRDIHVAAHLVCRSAPIGSPGNVAAMTRLDAIRVR